MSSRSFFLGCVGAAVIGFFAVGGAVVSSTHGLPAQASDLLAAPNVSCSSASPCATDSNALTGPGLSSTSTGGTGLTASTAFASTSASKFAAGLLGSDASTKGTFDAGVEGKSTRGIGVLGASGKSTGVEGTTGSVSFVQPAVLGLATAGAIGVEGKSVSGTSGIGVLGQGSGVAILGSASLSTSTSVLADGVGGLLFAGNGTGGQVFSVDNVGNVNAPNFNATNAITGPTADIEISAPGPAILGAAEGVGVLGFASGNSSGVGAVSAEGSGGLLFQGLNSSFFDVFNVDNSGNVSISGLIFTSGACSTGCIRTGASQTRVVSYAPRESQPTMEDVGEAQLIDGEARVTLDPAFSNVINKNVPYLVFAMPEGDCKGLFIAAKSATGFTVRELQGGRSSLAFEYRIVARPFADHSPRLPFVRTRSFSNELEAMRHHHVTR